MEQIIEYVKGIIESINASKSRIENKTLNQKDRQNMSTMLGEIIENINTTNLQQNEKMVQLSKHLANMQDAFFDMNSEEIFQNEAAIANILPDLEYEVSFNQLSTGIFQADSQIIQLQDEKSDLIQQLIELDMKEKGQLTDLTKQILEVNHVDLNEENSELEEIKKLIFDNEEEFIVQNDDEQKDYVGVVYIPEGIESNKRTIEGNSPEEVLKNIRSLQQDKSNPISKVKTVYIQKKSQNSEMSGTFSKFDIASGKDITPIYLQIPHSKPDEFKKITSSLKKNGAAYNPHKKAWYVTKEKDLSKFNEYLPEGVYEAASQSMPGQLINELDKPKETTLYDVKVPVDYSISSKGLKEVNQEVWNKIMKSTKLDNLDFSDCWFQDVVFEGHGTLKNSNFSNARFSDCKFNYIQIAEANFANATMQSCEINKSEFLNCNFAECSISNVFDTQSIYIDCNFERAYIRKGWFKQSVMDSPCFHSVTFNGVEFRNPIVKNASLLENAVFTMGGATENEVKEYENRTKEALLWYDKANEKTGLSIEKDEKFYKYFYDYESKSAEQFKNEKGWKMIWASENQGMNGDMYIVYRSVNDLPRFIQEYAKKQEQMESKKLSPAQNENKSILSKLNGCKQKATEYNENNGKGEPEHILTGKEDRS